MLGSNYHSGSPRIAAGIAVAAGPGRYFTAHSGERRVQGDT